MSATGVRLGYGLAVRVGRGVTPDWTVIPGVGDTEFPAGERGEVDVTSHTSPNATVEYIPDLIDNGSFTLPMDWVPESAADILLRVLRRTGEVIQLELTPAGTSAPEVYAAFVKSYGRSAPVRGKATASAVFRINGIVSGDAEDPDE